MSPREERTPKFVVYRKPGSAFKWGEQRDRKGVSLHIGRPIEKVNNVYVLYRGDAQTAEALCRSLQAALDERDEVVKAAHDHFNVTMASLLKGDEE